MAATLNPKFAKTTTPINSALTAAVKAAKPITLPTVTNNTNIQTAKPAVTTATVTSSPLKTTGAPAVSAPTTTAPTTSAPTTNSQNNWNALNNDSAYLTSEIARAQKVKADRAAQGLGTTDQDNYLTKLTGISAGTPYVPGAGATAGTGTPSGGTSSNYFGYDPGLAAREEIAANIAALQNKQNNYLTSTNYGVDTNNRYLQEQIDSFNKQKNVDMDAAQQLQNRRGGFYSGGLDYQLKGIEGGYQSNVGNLSRDIASRNQQLAETYGNNAQSIADEISRLQASEPQKIQNAIQDWITSQADIYGYNPITGESTQTGKNANLNAAQIYSNMYGKALDPQRDWSGYNRQGTSGIGTTGNPLMNTADQTQRLYENAYSEGRDKVKDSQWESESDMDIYKLLADQANAGTQPAATGPSVSTISTNINRALSALGNNVNVADPKVRNQIDQIILTQTQDPNTIAQLYTMYGIPIPDDLQAELSGK